MVQADPSRAQVAKEQGAQDVTITLGGYLFFAYLVGAILANLACALGHRGRTEAQYQAFCWRAWSLWLFSPITTPLAMAAAVCWGLWQMVRSWVPVR